MRGRGGISFVAFGYGTVAADGLQSRAARSHEQDHQDQKTKSQQQKKKKKADEILMLFFFPFILTCPSSPPPPPPPPSHFPAVAWKAVGSVCLNSFKVVYVGVGGMGGGAGGSTASYPLQQRETMGSASSGEPMVAETTSLFFLPACSLSSLLFSAQPDAENLEKRRLPRHSQPYESLCHSGGLGFCRRRMELKRNVFMIFPLFFFLR